jgi:hypothetical protein
MKLLSESEDWQVYQSDINQDLVFICQKNNNVGSLNMTVKKDLIQSLVQVLSTLPK